MLCSVLALLLAVACRDAPFTPDAAAPGAPAVHDLSAGTLLASTDFSEYAISTSQGVEPHDWTERWSGSGAAWKAWEDHSGDFRGDAKLRNWVGGASRHAVSWDSLGSPTDVRLHTRVRLSTNVGGMLAGLVVAGGGSGHHSATGYEFHFENYNGHFGVELIRFVDGDWIELGYHPYPFQADSFYHLVLERQGDALRAKVWKDGEAEPAAWQIEATDTVLSSGWVGFSNYTSSGIFEYDFLEVYDPNANPVPAEAPDTVPESMWAPENIVPFLGFPEMEVLRNVVSVRFKSSATQAERQAAIDLIDGEVIGGKAAPPGVHEGTYYVQIAGDSTGRVAMEAADRLEALPQVSNASFVLLTRPDDWQAWRIPDDSLAFDRPQWHVRFDPASYGVTWTHEIIDAPLAWGCETGSPDVSIAVVDRGFRLIDDLDENVETLKGLPPPDETDKKAHHGTTVAAVLGAEGDNRLGITGMMWNASLRLYDWTFDPVTNLPLLPDLMSRADELQAFSDRILQAGANGTRVINVALSAPFPEGCQPFSDQARVQRDSAIAEETAEGLRNALRDLAREYSARPLVVVAAGNDDVAADSSGLPRLATEPEFDDQVLAVGGINILAGFPSWWTYLDNLGNPRGSNYGTAVEIAAPAVLYSLFGDGSHDTAAGTSLAAPLVSGVAGLLLSANPTLSTTQLKDYILEGAQRGGRSVTDPSGRAIPILNAYESLKRAAEERGAPLCGNRVWAADGQIHARRSASVVEPLAPLASQPVGQVEPLHGGKEIVYRTLEGRRMLAWENGSWTEVPFPPADGEARRGGTTASVFGRSHDRAPERDSMAFVDDGVVSNTFWYRTQTSAEAPVILRPPGAADQQLASLTVQDTLGPVRETCLERDPASGFCYFSIVENRTWIFRLAYPQIGTEAYVTVSPMHHAEIAATAWAPCSFAPSHECREVQSLQEQQGAQVYTVDFASGAVAPVESFAEDMVFWIGQAETGESVVLGRGLWHITFWADPALYHQTGDPFHDFELTLTRCAIEYRQQAGFTSIETIPTPHTCNFGDTSFPSQGAGGGTIAPNLVPEAPRLSLGGETTGGAVSVPMPFFGSDGAAIESLSP